MIMEKKKLYTGGVAKHTFLFKKLSFLGFHSGFQAFLPVAPFLLLKIMASNLSNTSVCTSPSHTSVRPGSSPSISASSNPDESSKDHLCSTTLVNPDIKVTDRDALSGPSSPHATVSSKVTDRDALSGSSSPHATGSIKVTDRDALSGPSSPHATVNSKVTDRDALSGPSSPHAAVVSIYDEGFDDLGIALKSGRRGDPRMHRAVTARIKNQKTSLTEALAIGGFDVSRSEDDQGVTLSQRKNQLSRRIRIFRKQAGAMSADCQSPDGQSDVVANTTACRGTSCEGVEKASNLDVSNNQILATDKGEYNSAGANSTQTRLESSLGTLTSAQIQKYREQAGILNPVRANFLLSNSEAQAFDPSNMRQSMNAAAPFRGLFQPGYTGNYPGGASMDIQSMPNSVAVGNNMNAGTWVNAAVGDGSSTMPSCDAAFGKDVNNGNGRELFISLLRQQRELQDQLMKSFQQQGSLSIASGATESQNSTTSFFADQDLGKFHSIMPEMFLAAVNANTNDAATRDPPPSSVAAIRNAMLMQLHQQALVHNQAAGFSSSTSFAPQEQQPQMGGGANDSYQRRLVEQHISDATMMRKCEGEQNGKTDPSRKRPQQDQMGGDLGKHRPSSTSTPKNARCSSSYTTDPMRMQMALTLYKTEISAVIQRCMANAGFLAAELMENHPTYVLLASKAVENEIDRVNRLRKVVMGDDIPSVMVPWKSATATAIQVSEANIASTGPHGSDSQYFEDECNHPMFGDDHSLARSHGATIKEKEGPSASVSSTSSSSKPCPKTKSQDTKCFDGRHMHRLMGRCGHQAVVHNPSGGRPHIDFVVGDMVECYQNISPSTFLPSGGNGGGETIWPSRYKSVDLKVGSDMKCSKSDEGCDMQCASLLQGSLTPSLLETSDMWGNLDEWNFDFLEGGSSDETLLGLIELSKPTNGVIKGSVDSVTNIVEQNWMEGEKLDVLGSGVWTACNSD